MAPDITPRRNALATIILSFIVISQSMLIFVPVATAGGLMQTFSGGLGEVNLNLQGGVTLSATAELPRNATFASTSFEITSDHGDASVGQVWLDIEEDGTWEWAWNGTGYGDLSNQNQFSNGMANSTFPLSSNSSSGLGFILPSSATLASTSLNVSFLPEIGGGFYPVGPINDIVSANVDADSEPEVIALNESTNGKMVGVLEWNSTAQNLTSSWTETCQNATTIRTADIDNDGYDDVGIFDSSEMQLCVHYSSGSGLGAVTNISLPSGSVDASLEDMDGDGYADIVSANGMGYLNVRIWNSGTNSFSDNHTQMIEGNGTSGVPAQVVGFTTGEYHGSGNGSSVAVFDSMGFVRMWNYSASYWIGPMSYTFDGIKGETILHDFDGNGNNDLIGMGDGQVTLALFNGTDWNASTVYTAGVEISIIGDYDGNGNLELVSPNAGTPDGNDATFTGKMQLRHLNGTSIGSTSTYELTPWTAPTQVIFADLNGDGVEEHVVAGGESQKGLFISAWHDLSIDANNDSLTDATVVGYSGDGQQGLTPLTWSDIENTIEQSISPTLAGMGSGGDAYGNDLAYISPVITANGDGMALLSDLEVQYDVTLRVDENPHITANLTNVFNKNMQLGSGTFNLLLPFNSTLAGPITLSNMLGVWNDGAPNIAIPVQPQLILDEVNTTGVFFHWQGIDMWGEGLLGFQVFKTSVGGEFNFSAPISSSMMNQSIDTNIQIGQSYDYVVRSIHEFGITSNLSNRLSVTVPYPAPPDSVGMVSVMDVPGDSGGVLQVSWSYNSDAVDHYSIYIHSLGAQGIGVDGFKLLDPCANVSGDSPEPMTLVSTSSAIYDAMGGIISASQALNHNTEYWAAVIAVDQYGNQTFTANSSGPAVPRNDTLIPASLSIGFSAADADSGEDVSLLVAQSALTNGTLVTLNATLLLDGQPASGQAIALQISDGTNWLSYSGMTDSNGLMSQFTNAEWGTIIGANSFAGQLNITAIYGGNSGAVNVQPIAQASDSMTAMAGIYATLALLDDDVEVSVSGVAIIDVTLLTASPNDQSLLTGLTISWGGGNGTLNATATGDITFDASGAGSAAVLLNDGGWFNASFTPPAWLVVNPSNENPAGSPWVSATLRPYPYTMIDNNNSGEENQTTEIIAPTISCVAWTISNLFDDNESKTECTLTNPNDVPISVDWSTDLWTSPAELNAYPSKVTVNLAAGAEASFDIVSSPIGNLSLSAGAADFKIEGVAQSVGLSDILVEYTISYAITDDLPNNVNGDNSGTGGNGSNVNDDASSAVDSNVMTILLGAVGGVVVIILLVFVITRLKREDEEDWDEDDLEFEDPEESFVRTERPDDLPIGYSLDELKSERKEKPGKIVVEDISEDEAAESDPFNISRDKPEPDFEDYEDYGESEYDESEYEESDGESEQYDENVSVDEDGTEWWEDEEGVWWYRTSEMEDWAEYEE